MTSFDDVAQKMVDALRLAGFKRVHLTGEQATDPECIVIGVPQFRWQSPTSEEPTHATWPVAVIAKADANAVAVLLDMVPKVGAVLDTITEVAVQSADPGVWSGEGTPLPCYEITTEVNL